jgi:hypothetical protein
VVNPVPFTVKVNPGDPLVALAGVSDVMVGGDEPGTKRPIALARFSVNQSAPSEPEQIAVAPRPGGNVTQ